MTTVVLFMLENFCMECYHCKVCWWCHFSYSFLLSSTPFVRHLISTCAVIARSVLYLQATLSTNDVTMWKVAVPLGRVFFCSVALLCECHFGWVIGVLSLLHTCIYVSLCELYDIVVFMISV